LLRSRVIGDRRVNVYGKLVNWWWRVKDFFGEKTCYTASTPPLGRLRGLFYGEICLYLYLYTRGNLTQKRTHAQAVAFSSMFRHPAKQRRRRSCRQWTANCDVDACMTLRAPIAIYSACSLNWHRNYECHIFGPVSLDCLNWMSAFNIARFSLNPFFVLIRYFLYILSDYSGPWIRLQITPVTGNTIIMTHAC